MRVTNGNTPPSPQFQDTGSSTTLRSAQDNSGEGGVFGKLPIRLYCDFGFDGAEIGALYPSSQNRDVEHPVPKLLKFLLNSNLIVGRNETIKALNICFFAFFCIILRDC